MNDYIEKTVEFVKSKMSGEATGHDWWHVYRVWQNSKLIMKNEQNADTLIVELAALLHDISDWKFSNNDENKGADVASEFLQEIGLDNKTIEKIAYIITNLSFKGANVKDIQLSREGQIVQDADRLDALGAIGIARTFAYGAFAGQEIYNPDIKPKLHNTFEEYKKTKSTSLNHFYEKLLLLPERMNTEFAKKLALKRCKFMKEYLKQFFNEWNGIK